MLQKFQNKVKSWLVPSKYNSKNASLPIWAVYSSGGCGTKTLKKFLENQYLKRTKNKVLPIEGKFSHIISPPNSFEREARVIYLFANPMNMILSFFRRNEKENGWAALHCKHMQGNYEKIEHDCSLKHFLDKQKDLFKLYEHFDNWINANVHYPILFVRYESLVNTYNQDKMFDFLGITENQRKYFQWRKRNSNWHTLDKESQNQLWKLYGNLFQLQKNLPDVFIKKVSESLK